jgi:hypothetical protein
MEQKKFMEKVRFLMMAGGKKFSRYYSDVSPPIRERELIKKDYDFMEPCNYGKDVILSRMFQVMEGVRTDGIIVDEVLDGGRNIHRMKAYSASANSGKNVPQINISCRKSKAG